MRDSYEIVATSTHSREAVHPMNRSRGITLVVAAVAVLALGSAWAFSTNNSNSYDNAGMMSNNSQFNSVEAEMGMEHIHNLMLTDKELLIGTHQGLWSQITGEKATRVGGSQFDVMGMTMMNGMMVASGHPGEGEEDVNNLGFRMSMNGGMDWTSESLMGQIDFHRLAASGNSAMGISAGDGAMMRSDDSGKTWSTLSNPGLYDLAMNPTNSQMVMGTTQSGPMMSTDGGKNFKAMSNAPIMSLLSWDKSRLMGITPAGILHQSLDMGATWKKLATLPGEPVALTVKGKQVAVLAGSTIYYSTDGGNTFKERIVGVTGH